MTSPADRISHLVSTGKISAAEGERLQLALTQARAKHSAWRLLFNPFDRFGGERAAVVGVVVSAASLALGRFGAHFDGFLDVHAAARGGLAATFGTSLREQAVAWLVPSLLFWIYARVMASHARIVDFLGFVGLSRAALLAIAMVVVVADPALPTQAVPMTPSLAFVVAGTLPLLAWFFVLLFAGFRNASGLVEGKLVGGFVGITVASEVVAKVLLSR
jgi:hypothetical protein